MTTYATTPPPPITEFAVVASDGRRLAGPFVHACNAEWVAADTPGARVVEVLVDRAFTNTPADWYSDPARTEFGD